MKKFVCLIAVFLLCSHLSAREYHVSVKGKDTNVGSLSAPLRTIQAAADKAMPGDVITVHEGIYRERVVPPRGGESDEKRIIYQAAPGERVVISGSERVKGWEKVQDNAWKLTLPDSFFGESNPFDEQIYGSWYRGKGRPNHTGMVLLEGKRIRETFSLEDVLQPLDGKQPHWYAEADGNGGPVLMNFEWVEPVGGKRQTSMHASVKGGDAAICITIANRWPFGYLKDGSEMYFDQVDFGTGSDTLIFQAATLGKGGTVEMRLDTPDGELLGTSQVTNTGDWEKFEEFCLPMKRVLEGKHNLCLVVRAPELPEKGKTSIWAQFPDSVNPNKAGVEITVRPQVFYPEKTGIDYITVRGFILENAATNWAPPSAEQPGLIGPRWAKGWVIEANTIRNSRCAGISLGRPTFGHSHHYRFMPPRVYPEADGGQTEQQLLDYFAHASWNKEDAGFHVIRNNHIYDCGQAGIVGCSGAAFSVIEGNEIHDICLDETFEGDEMAGIKLHFAVDAIIRDNHIYNTIRGLWLDWGSQGMQVTGNLFHDNNVQEDIFIEVCHGPILLANNILLSGYSLNLSQGIAGVHNLVTGKVFAGLDRCAGGRYSFFYEPHGTVSVGNVRNMGGDLQWVNNHFAQKASLGNWDECLLPIRYKGNLFTAGAHPDKREKDFVEASGFDSAIRLEQRADGWYLKMNVPQEGITNPKSRLVTTETLDKAIIPQQAFVNPDDSPIAIDKDYLGNKRNAVHPYPGPIEVEKSGAQEWKVWPK